MSILHFGSVGPGVQLLQTALIRKGYELEADGVFGSRTRAAVEAFQKSASLAPDGIVGEKTHRALEPWYLGSLRYRVQRGDSLFKIAQRYGSSIFTIETANPGIAPNNLQIGAVITVPLDFPVVPTDIELCSDALTYCVRGLKLRYPFIRLSRIGSSVMGRPLWCMTLGSGANRVLYNAAHHANEWITSTLLLKFTEELAEAYAKKGLLFSQSVEYIFRRTTLALVPAVNPDGIDLVTGELTQGDYYDYARGLASDYPLFPFPAGWKANIHGVDLNLQYPAGWEQAKENKDALGIISPAPADYAGSAPLIAPESRALYDFTQSFSPALTLAYHTQGEVIYWKYLDYEPYNSRIIGAGFSSVSGYALEDTPYASAFAGYKDWFIESFNRPGYTIEAGRGENPLPIAQFENIYRDNLGILISGCLVT